MKKYKVPNYLCAHCKPVNISNVSWAPLPFQLRVKLPFSPGKAGMSDRADCLPSG